MSFLLKFISIISVLALSGCQTTKKQQASETKEYKTAPVFKILKDDKELGFLLGTIHYGVNFNELLPSIQGLASSADCIVLEADLAAAAPLVAGHFPPGKPDSLKKQLSEKEWDTLYKALEPILGINITALNQMNPFVAATLYTLSYLPPTQQPIDMALLSFGRLNSKKMVFLEKPEEQIDLLKKIQNIDSLKKTLNTDVKKTAEELQEIVEAYHTSNTELMDEVFKKQLSTKEYGLVLTQRNKNWLPIIEKKVFSECQAPLIAVGAGHLAGPKSVNALLESKGYSVIHVDHN